jgi:protoheme ferro-lyase
VLRAFGTPERVLDVVSFLELVLMGGEVVQQVQVTDRAGGL